MFLARFEFVNPDVLVLNPVADLLTQHLSGIALVWCELGLDGVVAEDTIDFIILFRYLLDVVKVVFEIRQTQIFINALHFMVWIHGQHFVSDEQHFFINAFIHDLIQPLERHADWLRVSPDVNTLLGGSACQVLMIDEPRIQVLILSELFFQ